MSVLIFADLENEGNFCQTSWEKSLSPVRMHVRYEETVSPGLELMWRAVYYRSSRELHLSVEVDESEEDISDLGEYLVEHGVSLDYVRNRMDSVLNEVVFPDFVSGFPGMKYSADDWGKVTVIREGLLS
ncbi:MAG: TipC family immunity protein [Bifidobacteriaceae bacterium]|nr:TipC family immunity protein [Bifidobacteriaceae bacterium]